MRNHSPIPRKILFGNVQASGGRLSPDGQWLSWIAPFEEVPNIWIAPSDQPQAGQPLTRSRGRPITWHEWTPDGRFVMFVNDENGDENNHVFVVDIESNEIRDLTPIKGVNARIALWSRQVSGKIVVAVNDRDTRWHDLYVVSVATGERELLWCNTQGFMSIGLDWKLRPRYACSSLPVGGIKLWRIDGSNASPWTNIDYTDSWLTSIRFFDADNERLLVKTCIGRDTAAFVWHNWESGDETVILEHSTFDVGGYLLNPGTLNVEAAYITGLRRDWIYVTPQVRSDFMLIQATLPELEFDIVSQSEDNRKWIIEAEKADQLPTTFLYDRDAGTITELFRSRPALAGYRLAPMRQIERKSTDGLNLVSYLTLPADVTDDRPVKPLPMVLIVHGGPWCRDAYGFRSDHQWLADRGYAVLSVNYRGSIGFGKSFIAASEKQHAGKMHDDLIEMVDWAISEGIAEKSMIAIVGESYGGYAAFVGATFTPDIFCCSVPVVGFTGLETMLDTIPPYWTGFASFMYRSYGDPRTQSGRDLLAERSPIYKVDNVKKPMLIFHGQNDVRCNIAESDAFVTAMQAKGIPVTYVVYPDEGHWFAKQENRIAYLALMEAFLSLHLGGTCEPFGADLADSSHQIRAGAEIFRQFMNPAKSCI